MNKHKLCAYVQFALNIHICKAREALELAGI